MGCWHSWIGLPHAFGANPEDGVGCDCLVMAWLVLAEARIPRPPFDQQWLDLARSGCWPDLEHKWNSATRQLPAPAPYALTLFNNGSAGLGVGVVVDNGLLMVHHKRGVCWLPLAVVRRLPYYEFI